MPARAGGGTQAVQAMAWAILGLQGDRIALAWGITIKLMLNYASATVLLINTHSPTIIFVLPPALYASERCVQMVAT